MTAPIPCLLNRLRDNKTVVSDVMRRDRIAWAANQRMHLTVAGAAR